MPRCILTRVKREFPFDPLTSFQGRAVRANPPETELIALQEAGTLEPRESLEEQTALRETVVSALDILNAEEAWLLNALLFERLSLRQIERRIGIPKTTVARYRDKILAKLRVALANDPAIHDYLST